MLVDDVVVVVKVFEFIDEAIVINEHPSLFLKFLDLLVAAGDDIDKAIIQYVILSV
jgi:hypothetical protein